MAAPSVSRTFRRWCWHGNACPPKECRDIPALLRIDGDADAGLDYETMSFQYKGLFQGHEQLVRGARGAHGGGRRQEQTELIPAEPRDRVRFAQDALEARGQLLQQRITAGVAK